MTVDEILFGTKNINIKSLVCQIDIKTNEDIEKLNENKYNVAYTLDSFVEAFPNFEPKCIHYLPSFSQPCIYFNLETLAACPFHIEFVSLEGFDKFFNGTEEVIKEREEEVKHGNFMGSILTLPDAMRFEYFELLLQKYPDTPNIYSLFFSIYQSSEYGFSSVSPETIAKVLKYKTDEDRKVTEKEIKGLPDVVTVYRGGNNHSTPYNQGFSWTTNINVANFFACRHGKEEGYIAKGKIRKSDIIEAYFKESAEVEIIVSPKNVEIEEVLTLSGMNFLKDVIPKVAQTYWKYRNKMETLEFAQNSEVHGQLHEARVLLMCLILSDLLKLPSSDVRVLATAAIYHDTGRTTDGVDAAHGYKSRLRYEADTQKPDPLVSFLIEYHSRPDEDGYAEIKRNRALSKNRRRAEKLFNLFKDADALDRVRFGVRDLDLNQLRIPESKILTLVAEINLQNVKLK